MSYTHIPANAIPTFPTTNKVNDSIIFENEPLDTLLGTLPKTLGLMKSPVSYTCFDVSQDYFAVGSNLGLVCLYSFQSQNMQFIQNRSDPISCILLDSSSKWVAIGDKQGAVTVQTFNKEMVFATQEKLHSSVTCLTWGTNSRTLFSGYASGKIIVSDYDSNKFSLYSKVLIESGPHIFQVNYHRNILLVSNYLRSYLVQLEEDFQVLNITNIGSKDRKPGYYGATFFENGEGKKKIAVARPGFRVWIVSLDGIVESTAKLRESIFSETSPLISFMGRTQPSLIPSTDLQLTILMTFQDRYLVSWCQNHLWIIDPVELKVLGQTTSLRNVRWTISDEADLYIFHDGYQIFRKISLQPEHVVRKVIVPELLAPVSSAFSEGDIIQEVNGKQITSHDKDLYNTELAIHDQLEKYPMLQSSQINNETTTPIPTTTTTTNNNNNSEDQTNLDIIQTPMISSNSSESVGTNELTDSITLTTVTMTNTTTNDTPVVIEDVHIPTNTDGINNNENTIRNNIASSTSPKSSTAQISTGLQNRLIDKLPFNEELLKKTKSFFKDSVGPILEKTTTSFLKQTTHVEVLSEEIETKDNTEDNAQEDTDQAKPENVDLNSKPDEMCAFAFASKAEQNRRLATLQLNDDEDLIVNIVKKKNVKGKQKRRRRGQKTPSRAESLNSLVTDTASDLSEQTDLDSATINTEEGDLTNKSGAITPPITCEDTTKDSIAIKDIANKEEIRILREEQEKTNSINFAFSYLSESSKAISLREIQNEKSCSQESQEHSDHIQSHDKLSDLRNSDQIDATDYTNTEVEDTNNIVEDNNYNNPQLEIKCATTEIASINFTSAQVPDSDRKINNLLDKSSSPSDLSDGYDIITPNAAEHINHPLNDYLVLDINEVTNSTTVMDGNSSLSVKHEGVPSLQNIETEDSISNCYAKQLNRILDTSNKDKYHERENYMGYDHYETTTITSPPTTSTQTARNEILSSMTLEEQLQPSSEMHYSSNSWSSFRLPFTPYAISLTVSDSAVWLAEGGKGQIYWCKISQSSISWKYISGLTAKQLAASYNGKVVLAVTKDNKLYKRSGMGPDNHQGTSWKKIGDEISYIACGPTTLWAISFSGMVLFSNNTVVPYWQTVPSVNSYVQIASSDTITIALGTDDIVYLRTGITAINMMGDSWLPVTTFAVESIAICLTTIWVVSTEGTIYFNPDVRQCHSNNASFHPNSSWYEIFVTLESPNSSSPAKPHSFNKIPYAIAQTAHTVFMPSIQMLPNGVRKFGSKFSHNNTPAITLSNTKRQICCSILSGVWVLVEGVKVYHCTSQLIGVNYLPLYSFNEMTSPFLSVAASYALNNGGEIADHIWGLKANGDIVCYDSSRKMHQIPADRSMELTTLSACDDSVWGIDLCKRCWVRIGISRDLPLGDKWVLADLGNLPLKQLISVSCGLLSIWVVDVKGKVWLRFGRSPKESIFGNRLSPVWFEINQPNNKKRILMKEVVVGPGEWKVWAISQNNKVYFRKGITSGYPIGTEWELVPDMLATKLALSIYHTWVLDMDMNLHIRLGVSQNNHSGYYWKPVLGRNLTSLAVTPHGQLWCVDNNGMLKCRLEKNYLENDLVSTCVAMEPSHSKYSGWEIL